MSSAGGRGSTDEVFVLGGYGRTGRSVADDLATSGVTPVLVGRDAGRLAEAARPGGHRTVVAASAEAMATAVVRERPTVVLNTIGPFTRTAPPLVGACLAAGSEYVDLANDMAAVPALLARQGDAVRSGRTLVTGAGFGVTATESVVAWLCEGADPAERVRVDMVPSLALEAGRLGEALAGTLVEGLPGVPGGGRFQGRRVADGVLAAASIGGGVLALRTPEGDEVSVALMPLGELVAAQRASGARFVDAASSEAPSGRLVRLALPVAASLLHLGVLRRFVAGRLAAVRFADRPAPREHSWGHADVAWSDGTAAEGWVRLPEAQAATVAIAAEVARRLARHEGRPGAFTPAALFGHQLLTSLGAEYLRVEGR
ncbi:saccharopine dehydrogenase NADP-binding domain-containing protein [uncultured Friedmanniella sp.]|uniref:saccharopine dehydrogenase NADP-binding domain-containing protein n=1 Tax=uncultured Friedmanniella sp. TaxID=335381 RepID=UPI0035CAECD0